MKRVLQSFIFSATLAAPFAFGADSRYTLSEYSMNNCPACVAALQDVARLTDAGVEVRCVNTDVDQGAAREARKYNLKLRPAWRLATSDGKEVARWYGAGKSSVILATIKARFPKETESAPEVDPMKEPEDEPTPPEPELAAPVPESEPPSLLEQIDAELGAPLQDLSDEIQDNPIKAADFRERKPVYERFSDPSFLDKSLDEWNRRDEEEEDSEEESPDIEEEEEEEDARLFNRRRNPTPRQEPKQRQETDPLQNAALGDRIADRAAARILLGLEDKCDELKREALKKLDEIGKGAQDALVEEFQRQLGDVRGELEPKLTDETAAIRAEVVKEVQKGFSSLSALCSGLILLCSVLSTAVTVNAIKRARL